MAVKLLGLFSFSYS